MATKKINRSSNWTIVVYPESAPTDWQSILEDMHIEFIVSPLHDNDLNADGEPKKAHWHVLLLFGSLKSYEQVRELTEALKCPIPTICHNTKALVRYMAHLDNPDKAQYSKEDIKVHGGVSLDDLLKPTSSERYSIIRDMKNWCNDNDCCEFEVLFSYAAEQHYNDWFPLLCDNCSFVMSLFLKSKRHNSGNHVVDKDTGEIY